MMATKAKQGVNETSRRNSIPKKGFFFITWQKQKVPSSKVTNLMKTYLLYKGKIIW